MTWWAGGRWVIACLFALTSVVSLACTPIRIDGCADAAVVDADRRLQAALHRGELKVAEQALSALRAQTANGEAGARLLRFRAEGEFEFHRGRMQAAAQAFAAAREIAIAAGMTRWAQTLAVDEGIALRDAGSLWAALQRLESARTAAAASYRLDANLATLYAQLGAVDLAARLLHTHAEKLEGEDALDARVRLAQLQLDLGHPEAASQYLLGGSCPLPACARASALLRWWALELMAEAERRQQRPDSARRYYRQLWRALPEGVDRATAELGLLRVELDAGRLEQASAHFRALESLDAGEETRWAALALALRLPAQHDDALQALTAALPQILASSDLARTPEFRLRRRLDILQAVLDAWLARGSDADLQAAFELMPALQRLGQGWSSLLTADPAPIRAAANDSQARDYGDREHATARARGDLPASGPSPDAGAARRPQTAVWVIQGRTALLRRGERLWSATIEPQEVDLLNHIDLLVSGDPAWRATAARLYRRLGGRLLDQACAAQEGLGPCAEVIIRADPGWSDLPFATLVDSEDRMLLERLAVRMDDVVPGEPEVQHDRAVIVAHSGRHPGLSGPWWERLGLVDARLRDAGPEALEIAQRWSQRELLRESAAQRRRIEVALGEPAGVLHVAAHALLNPWRPRRSALLLAADANGNPWWEAADIAAAEIDVDVVVLAACQSARRGARWRGGLGGLADAFLQAGARSVIGSLWSVEDGHTRSFMRSLYARLDQEGAAEALRQTQWQFSRQGQPSAAWAGWVLRD